MMRLIPTLAAILAFAGFMSSADARLFRSMDAKTFAQTVAAANEFEIQSSKLTLQKSQNDAVKQFAQRMIDDHTALAEKLRAALQKVNLPVPGDKLKPEQARMINFLQTASGAKFDQSYIHMQLKGHEGAVKLFGRYARNGTNSVLKEFASEGLPVIQKHLELVKELKRSAAPALTRYGR